MLQQNGDPTRFLNTMAFADAEAEAAHRASGHVRAYVGVLYPRCVEQPVFTGFVLRAER